MSNKGFTLLEVMIAVSIMAIAFSAILMVQSGSIQSTLKAREITVAAMLAKNAMSLTELDMEGKRFSEIKEEETFQFDKPFDAYTWTRKVKELEFPNFSAAAGKTGDDSQNAEATEMFGKMFTTFLNQAIREITVSISWERGNGRQSYQISTYWVDLNSDFRISQ